MVESKAKNLLLYLKYSNSITKECDSENIFCFDNNKIVAVDEFEYNREERYSLQKKLYMKPYYISPLVFEEIIREICEEQVDFILRDVIFAQDFIKDTEEFKILEDYIYDKELHYIYKMIFDIIEEFDTSIKKLKFNYKGYDFELTGKGVISVLAPLDTIKDLTHDYKFNKLILGAV